MQAFKLHCDRPRPCPVQWFYFDSAEALPDEQLPESEYEPTGSRRVREGGKRECVWLFVCVLCVCCVCVVCACVRACVRVCVFCTCVCLWVC